MVLTGAEFEHYVCEVFYDNGHHSAVTKASGDYGVDLVLDGKIAVKVKMYTSPVGPGAVQQVIAGKVMYGCAEAWVVTNSTFTPAARALAKANDVRLIAGDELQWIADNPDKTADHRARYEVALAEAEEKKRAKLEALRIAYAKGQGPKPPPRRGDGPDRRTIAPPGPPSVRQRIAGWKSRREAEAIADQQAARAKQVADWHTRTGAWWRRQETARNPLQISDGPKSGRWLSVRSFRRKYSTISSGEGAVTLPIEGKEPTPARSRRRQS